MDGEVYVVISGTHATSAEGPHADFVEVETAAGQSVRVASEPYPGIDGLWRIGPLLPSADIVEMLAKRLHVWRATRTFAGCGWKFDSEASGERLCPCRADAAAMLAIEPEADLDEQGHRIYFAARAQRQGSRQHGVGGTVVRSHEGPDGTRVVDEVRLTEVSLVRAERDRWLSGEDPDNPWPVCPECGERVRVEQAPSGGYRPIPVHQPDGTHTVTTPGHDDEDNMKRYARGDS